MYAKNAGIISVSISLINIAFHYGKKQSLIISRTPLIPVAREAPLNSPKNSTEAHCKGGVPFYMGFRPKNHLSNNTATTYRHVTFSGDEQLSAFKCPDCYQRRVQLTWNLRGRRASRIVMRIGLFGSLTSKGAVKSVWERCYQQTVMYHHITTSSCAWKHEAQNQKTASL